MTFSPILEIQGTFVSEKRQYRVTSDFLLASRLSVLKVLNIIT